MPVKYLRTPEERFASLPDFDFKPRYFEIESMRMAFIDERTPDFVNSRSETFLCLHGVPTFSYLYRKMIPYFLASNNHHKRGVRVCAPDWIGFGRSDKPVSTDFHSIEWHRQSMFSLIEALDLRNVTVVCQDWGGIFGMTLALNENVRARISRVIFFNSDVPTSETSPAFKVWKRRIEQTKGDIDVSRLIGMAVGAFGKPGPLTSEERRAYDAPYPSKEFKAALAKWPLMVPTNPKSEGMDLFREARDFWARNQRDGDRDRAIKVFVGHGLQDMVFGADKARDVFNLCVDRRDTRLYEKLFWFPNAGHFCQEVAGRQFAEWALKEFGDIPKELVEWRVILRKDQRDMRVQAKENRFVALVTLNNPPANVQNGALLERFASVLSELNENPIIGGVIIRGNTAGKRIFSAGYDVDTFLLRNESVSRRYFEQIEKVNVLLREMRVPVFAMVNGHAVAGGFVLAMRCDYRVTRADSKFALTESQLGIEVGEGTFRLVSNLVGSPIKAQRIFSTARMMSGKECEQLGLVEKCIDTKDDADLLNACLDEMNDWFNAKPACLQPLRAMARPVIAQGTPEELIDDSVRRFHSDTVQAAFLAFKKKRKRRGASKL